MSLPIIADPTDAGFNCYVSLDEATIILGGRLNSTNWDNASETNRSRALLTATELLDRHVSWYGSVTVATQNLGWPRQEIQIYGRPIGTYFDSAIIPDIIKLATAEYANELLGEDLTADQATGLSSLSVGSISLDFNKSDRKDSVPDAVKMMVVPYGAVQLSNPTTVRLVRA